MNALERWKYITERATAPSKSWTVKELAEFHYFNPNGLHTKKKAMDAKIDDAVTQGKAKSGAIIAYGGFNNFNENRLMTATQTKRPDRISLKITLEGLRGDIRKAQEFLDRIGHKE